MINYSFSQQKCVSVEILGFIVVFARPRLAWRYPRWSFFSLRQQSKCVALLPPTLFSLLYSIFSTIRKKTLLPRLVDCQNLFLQAVCFPFPKIQALGKTSPKKIYCRIKFPRCSFVQFFVIFRKVPCVLFSLCCSYRCRLLPAVGAEI